MGVEQLFASVVEGGNVGEDEEPGLEDDVHSFDVEEDVRSFEIGEDVQLVEIESRTAGCGIRAREGGV